MTEDHGKPIRVTLVEDHAPFRRAMATLLNRQPDVEVVAQAGSLKEARRHAASVGFDVAVLDLGLPDGDGVDVIPDLRRAGTGAAVMVLSNSGDPTDIERATEAGAGEFLAKFASPDEVLGAVRRLAGR